MKNKKIFYTMFSPIVLLLFEIVFFPKIKGKEYIPKGNGAILAGNHLTNLDCFMVMSGTRRCIHFLAKSELFKFKLTNWFFKNSGLIPVYRNGKDRKALEAAIDYLKKGELVGIFPEGTVNKTQEKTVLPFKIGAVKMARETGCPIVPFTIRGKYIPFARTIEIVFQEPYFVIDENLQTENEKLVGKVCSKLDEK